MRFWDSSAIVPLLVQGPVTAGLVAEFRKDPLLVVWWGTRVECASALARLERAGALSPASAREAFARLGAEDARGARAP